MGKLQKNESISKEVTVEEISLLTPFAKLWYSISSSKNARFALTLVCNFYPLLLRLVFYELQVYTMIRYTMKEN